MAAPAPQSRQGRHYLAVREHFPRGMAAAVAGIGEGEARLWDEDLGIERRASQKAGAR